MNDEFNSLIKNNIWKLISLSLNRKIFKNKWIFKFKRKLKEEIVHHKARWIIKEFK